jgi:hypothetical protein
MSRWTDMFYAGRHNYSIPFIVASGVIGLLLGSLLFWLAQRVG